MTFLVIMNKIQISKKTIYLKNISLKKLKEVFKLILQSMLYDLILVYYSETNQNIFYSYKLMDIKILVSNELVRKNVCTVHEKKKIRTIVITPILKVCKVIAQKFFVYEFLQSCYGKKKSEGPYIFIFI